MSSAPGNNNDGRDRGRDDKRKANALPYAEDETLGGSRSRSQSRQSQRQWESPQGSPARTASPGPVHAAHPHGYPRPVHPRHPNVTAEPEPNRLQDSGYGSGIPQVPAHMIGAAHPAFAFPSPNAFTTNSTSAGSQTSHPASPAPTPGHYPPDHPQHNPHNQFPPALAIRPHQPCQNQGEQSPTRSQQPHHGPGYGVAGPSGWNGQQK